jgi:hypothetical protein
MQMNYRMRPCFFQWVVACRKPPIEEASLGSEIVFRANDSARFDCSYRYPETCHFIEERLEA